MPQPHKKPRQMIDKGGQIRACKLEDLASIADLFSATFGSCDARGAQDLRSYLQQVYFENPWADDAFASLVFEQNGVLEGFLGIVPRPMEYRGKRIQAAVSSALMVRKGARGIRNPLPGIALMRHFLQGPQDLSLTDTANESSRRLWTACGGKVAYAYSYSWTRPIQPLATMMELGGYADTMALRIVKPAVRIVDGLLGNMRGLRPGKPEGSATDIDTNALLTLLETITDCSLIPKYDLPSLEWLIGMAEQSTTEGGLAKRCVRDTNGDILGWYIFYKTKGKLARVLQFSGKPRAMREVLGSLAFDAKEAGATALWGRTEPRYAGYLNEQKCLFLARPWVLVHARDPELVESFCAADAFFTGLEGELWMKVNA